MSLRILEASRTEVDVQGHPAFSHNDDLPVSRRPSIANSSKWVLAGTVLSRPIQLFTNVLIARLLGPASFGVLGLATSLAVTLSLMASLGLGDAVNKYVAEYYRTDRAKGAQFAAVIAWAMLGFTVVFLLALWFARVFWVSSVFPSAISAKMVGLTLWLALMNLLLGFLVGVFSGLQKFRDFAIINLFQACATATFAIVLAFYGTEGAILAYACGTSVAVLWAIIKLWRTDRKILMWPGISAFQILKPILRFSTPIWIGAFTFAPFVTFCFAFLAHRPNGAFELGVFNTANGLRMLVTLLPGAIAIAVAPAILEEGGMHGEKAAYARLIDKSFFALIFLTMALLIPCLFLSDLIFTIYGKAYGDSYRLFIPLTASAAIGAIGTPLGTIMLAKNKTWWGFFFGLVKSILLVAVTILLVPRLLATGLVWAFVLSEIALYVVVLEFCVYIKALPRGIRTVFYSAIISILALTSCAMFLPPSVRWLLALPLTAAVLVYYLRAHREMASWLTDIVPGPLKPRTQRILSFLAT